MKTSRKIRNFGKTLGLGLGMALLMEVGPFASEAQAQRILVDDDQVECPDADFTSIQAAVDAAQANAIIRVCPGIYPEQVVIEKSLKITGDNGAVIIPQNMQANASHLITNNAIAAVVLVKEGNQAALHGLTIDGINNGLKVDENTCEPFLMGVLYQNASGEVENMAIRNLFLDNQELTCENGHGVFVQSSPDGEAKVRIRRNSIHDYQKGGIVANGDGTRVEIKRNIITGLGSISSTTANGIQVGFGAKGIVTANTVADNIFEGCISTENCRFAAASILVFNAEEAIIHKNLLGNSQANLQLVGDQYKVTSNNIYNSNVLDGIFVAGDENQIIRNNISNSDEAAVLVLSGDENKIVENRINEALFGILIEKGDDNSIQGNRFFNTETPVSILEPEEPILSLSAQGQGTAKNSRSLPLAKPSL